MGPVSVTDRKNLECKICRIETAIRQATRNTKNEPDIAFQEKRKITKKIF